MEALPEITFEELTIVDSGALEVARLAVADQTETESSSRSLPAIQAPVETGPVEVSTEAPTVLPAKIKRDSCKDRGDLDTRLLDIYLEEASDTELLIKDEEMQLAQTIENGKEAAEKLADKSQKLSSARKRTLRQQAKDGHEARNHFIESNLKLVVSIAKKYQGRGVEMLDLVQEGNFGLFEAVDKFDWRRGFKFSTYATWWIRQRVRAAIDDQSRTIRIPTHVSDEARRYYQEKDLLADQLNRPPTIYEMAEVMNTDPMTLETKIAMYRHNPRSLDETVREDSETLLVDTIEDETSDQGYETVNNMMTGLILVDLLSTLNDRERQIITLRYGLDGAGERTLREVSGYFGVTHERVRQIETKVLKKLQQPDIKQRLEVVG